MAQGIRHLDAERLAREIEQSDLDATKKQIAAEELESTRDRQEELIARRSNGVAV